MDFEVRAKVNALFNEIEELKNERKRMMELIKNKEEQIMRLLSVGQEVIVYKDDKPHILSIKIKNTTKFNRADLASDIGVPQNKLNIPGVAELTEKRLITSQSLEKYWTEESEPKIHVKKATELDVERLSQFSIDGFIE